MKKEEAIYEAQEEAKPLTNGKCILVRYGFLS
jgi:hypothetical protein